MYADAPANFILVLSTLTLYAVTVGSLTRSDRYPADGIGMIGNVTITYLVRPFLHIADSFGAIFARLKGKKKQTGGFNFMHLLTGLLLSVPVLLIVLPLLIRADAAFGKIFENIFSNIGLTVLKLILAVFIFPFIFSAIWGMVNQKSTENVTPPAEASTRRWADPVVSVTVLAVLSVFYIIFVFSQLAHYVSAFSGMLPEGYDNTPAAYARQGFFEMITISAINLVIIGFVALLTKRGERKNCRRLH